MAVLHALVVAVALAVLACLPYIVAMLIVSVDEYVERAGRALRRVLRASLRVLARHCGWRWLHVDASPAPVGPPIEQIAADLRRLGRQRLTIASRSPVWFTAVQRAYDERLCLACQSLGIEQHLTDLDGLDLEIERVRVEGELLAAGLVLAGGDVDCQGRP